MCDKPGGGGVFEGHSPPGEKFGLPRPGIFRPTSGLPPNSKGAHHSCLGTVGIDSRGKVTNPFTLEGIQEIGQEVMTAIGPGKKGDCRCSPGLLVYSGTFVLKVGNRVGNHFSENETRGRSSFQPPVLVLVVPRGLEPRFPA